MAVLSGYETGSENREVLQDFLPNYMTFHVVLSVEIGFRIIDAERAIFLGVKVKLVAPTMEKVRHCFRSQRDDGGGGSTTNEGVRCSVLAYAVPAVRKQVATFLSRI